MPLRFRQHAGRQGNAGQGVVLVVGALAHVGLHQDAEAATRAKHAVILALPAVQVGQRPDVLRGLVGIGAKGEQVLARPHRRPEHSRALGLVGPGQGFLVLQIFRSQRHAHFIRGRRGWDVVQAAQAKVGQGLPQAQQPSPLVGQRTGAQSLDHAAIGPRQAAPVLPGRQDALDALETALVIGILVQRLVVQFDGFERRLQLVVEDVGRRHQVTGLVLSKGHSHQPLKRLDDARPVAIEGVDLHQLVQDIRVVGPQGGGLQEGLQGGTGILQFFALQTTHAAEILEPFVGGEVSCEQPAKLLDESSRIGRTATFDPGVGLGQRLAGHH